MKARSVKNLDPEDRLDENAARIVQVRLDEMRSFAKKARKPKASRAQHDMRIAAKRLRYVLEVTDFCFGRPAEVARRRSRDLQDILGEVHDCDVMLPRVLDHLEQMRSEDAMDAVARAGDAPDLEPSIAGEVPHRTAYRGLEVLAVYLRARRQILFDRFLKFWERQEEQGTWLRLERAVEGVLLAAEARRRAERAAEARRVAAEREAEAKRAAEEAEQALARSDVSEADRPVAADGPGPPEPADSGSVGEAG